MAPDIVVDESEPATIRRDLSPGEVRGGDISASEGESGSELSVHLGALTTTEERIRALDREEDREFRRGLADPAAQAAAMLQQLHGSFADYRFGHGAVRERSIAASAGYIGASVIGASVIAAPGAA